MTLAIVTTLLGLWGLGITATLAHFARPTWALPVHAPTTAYTRITLDSDHRGLV